MSRYRTTGCFLLLAAIWGTAFMATDVGLADLPPVPFAAVLLGLVPVVTPALTRLASSDDTFTANTGVGVVLGFAGVVVIADPDPANLLASTVGIALVFAAALAFAIPAVITHDTSSSMSFLGTQAWLMAVGAVGLHVAGIGGCLLYFGLLDQLGPIEMSFIEYVIPLFAALAGWLVVGQPTV